MGYAERNNSVLLVLADGLGGHARGELASELLVQSVIHAFQSIRKPLITQPSAFLALAILHAHRAIGAMGKAQDPPIEPRTTCVVCLVQDGYAYWAHVGDSRLYLFRNNKLMRRTKDHTIIERLRQEGVLSDEEMVSHPEKSRLLKCVGGPREPTIALGEETALMPDDVLLLCTDGLWEALSTDIIATYLKNNNLEDALIDMLMDAETKMKNHSDNISATCLCWEDELTDKAPLQSKASGNVNQKTLWSGAVQRRAGTLNASKKPPAKNGSLPDPENDIVELDSEIKELEAYLNQFLPKR